MALWLLMGWIFLIGVITGALIRQFIYLTKAERIRNKVWKKCK